MLFDRVAELEGRLERVERRLGQNSRNSSLPPSSDRGQAPKRPPRKRSKRRPGGLPGHEGRSRGLVEDPDETVEHRPASCRRCGRELGGGDRVAGRPARHQVIDLPDTVVVTTEHRLVRVVCLGCGARTRAELPAGVERGAFGPRLRATVVTLAAMLMSRRQTLTLLRDMFGARISLGSVEKVLKDASELLAAPWEAVKQAVQAADVANADETSWAKAAQRLWLWAALSATAACYQIDHTRARTAAKALLGDFDGLLVTDRYGVYDFVDPGRRQVCLGHLARNFQAFAERDGPPGRHGQAIRQAIDDVIRADTAARDEGRALEWHTGPGNDLHDQLMDAVEAGERSHTAELSRLCGTVLDIWPTLWNFTDHPGAEATNYAEVRVMPRSAGFGALRREVVAGSSA